MRFRQNVLGYGDAVSDAGDPSWRRDVFAAAALSLAIFCLAHFDAFRSPYVVNDDVRQQIYWMQTWRDAALYPDDLLTRYARRYVPWGVQAAYRVACLAVDPLRFSVVLTGVLFVACATGFHRLGRSLGGRSAGWSVLCVFWLMPYFLFKLSGGLSHSFAFPALVWFLHFWSRRSATGMAAVLALAGLFVPYVFVLCAAAVGLAWSGGIARERVRRRRNSGRGYGIRQEGPPFRASGNPVELPASGSGANRWTPFLTHWVHWLVPVAVGATVLAWQKGLSADGIGPIVTAADMAGRPEFTAQGRYPILPVPSAFSVAVLWPLRYIVGRHGMGSWAAASIAGVLAGGVWRALRTRPWPGAPSLRTPFGFLLLASLILFGAARLFLLRLFVPDRYLIFTVNVLYCVLLGAGADVLFRSARRAKARVAIGAAMVASVLRLHGVGLYDYSSNAALYEWMRATPPNSLVAGHPFLMDDVLTFGRRRVFVSFELAHPWFRGLWSALEPRLRDLFEAHYAEEAAAILQFARRHGIDFLVVDDRHFAPEFLRKGAFFAPFDAAIRGATEGRRRFAALRDDLGPTTKIDAHVRIIDLRIAGKPGKTRAP